MKKVHFIILSFVFLFSNDLLANRLYWGDGHWGDVNYIKSCDSDGSDPNIVIELDTNFYGALDVSVDQTNSQLYSQASHSKPTMREFF